jgi:hypothetical protein
MVLDLSILGDVEANLEALEIDEIKKRLEPLITGYRIASPIFDPGAFVCRARRVTPSFRKQNGIGRSDLIYPPAEFAKLGRLNRAGAPVFYCSVHKGSVFFELQGLQAGEELILAFWKANERMFVNNIGYTEFAFRQLGATRPMPQWEPKLPEAGSDKETVGLTGFPPEVVKAALSHDDSREIREAFSVYFMRSVGPDERYRYKLTTAIGELHLGRIENQQTQFAGVLYPSTRMWGNGDNLALLPWFVDAHLEFRKAVHVRVDSSTETTFEITYLDSAREFDEHGNLIWLGRIPRWTLKPGQNARFTFALGADDDGDFQMSKDGQPCHWIAIDAATGQPIELS